MMDERTLFGMICNVVGQYRNQWDDIKRELEREGVDYENTPMRKWPAELALRATEARGDRYKAMALMEVLFAKDNRWGKIETMKAVIDSELPIREALGKHFPHLV